MSLYFVVMTFIYVYFCVVFEATVHVTAELEKILFHSYVISIAQPVAHYASNAEVLGSTLTENKN